MSQSIGLMADLDIETEHLRWMGDTRFIVGYLCASKSLLLRSPSSLTQFLTF